MTLMRIVVALGGNALLQRGQVPDAAAQVENIRVAVAALAPLALEHDLLITHGNGPQVGVLAMESAADPRLTGPYPFDALGAMTQGLIGYWVLQAFGNALPEDKPMTAVINQTLVDLNDPAFENPTKFVGEVYDEAQARELAARYGWQVRQDGPHWRRVIASPQPLRIIEVPLIRRLMGEGVLVVCAGGGGVPVAMRDGDLVGVEAVIDKDLSAAMLAVDVEADLLMVLTDVASVVEDFGTPQARPIGRIPASELRAKGFPAGSMGPKVEAACRYVQRTGKRAVIGRLADAGRLVDGEVGTYVVP
jgi:carbamate kinase